MPGPGWQARNRRMWRTELSDCCQESFDDSPETEPGTARGRPSEDRLGLAQRLALLLLWLYKTSVSPLLMSCCKFHPTCSEYAREAIASHGVLRGSRLAAARLLRCRPFAPGGIDPVPESRSLR